MGKVNEESSTGGLGIPNPLSIKYEDEDYVKEVAKSLFANANLSEIDSNGNIVNLGDGKVKAIADRCVKYARMLLNSLNS